jgi:serine phosphatase RsbU (regulator of sigma subunit)
MVLAATGSTSSGKGPRRPELGHVDGLDLHAQYLFDRTGGDFFDAVRIGPRIAFLLCDIAGRRPATDLLSAAMQETFRTHAANLFGAGDANLTEGTEMLVREINLSLMAAAKGICFAPTMIGCYDVQLGILAYVNAGGQAALVQDSDGTRALPNASLPLGLFTHMTYDASMQAIEPGAKLLIVSKGVTGNLRGKEAFGERRVLDVLESSKQDSASGLCRAVLEASHEFEMPRLKWLRFWQRSDGREDMTALAMVRNA